MGGNRERDDEGRLGTTGQGALHAPILPQREKPTILMGGTPEEVEGRLQGEGWAPPTQADCSPPPGPGGRALPTRSCLLQSALRNLPAQSRVPAQPQQLRPGAPTHSPASWARPGPAPLPPGSWLTHPVPGDPGPEIPAIPRDRVISAPHLRLGVSSEPVEHTHGSVPKAACGRERCGGHPIRIVQTFLEVRRGSQLLRLFWSLVSLSWPIPRAKDDLTSCQFLESE